MSPCHHHNLEICLNLGFGGNDSCLVCPWMMVHTEKAGEE